MMTEGYPYEHLTEWEVVHANFLRLTKSHCDELQSVLKSIAFYNQQGRDLVAKQGLKNKKALETLRAKMDMEHERQLRLQIEAEVFMNLANESKAIDFLHKQK